MASLGSIALIKGCRKTEVLFPESSPEPKPVIAFRNISWKDIYTKEVHDYYDRIIPNENSFDKKVYIDPEYNGRDSDGSIEKPFLSLLDITGAEDTAFLIKRGTTHSIDTGVGNKRVQRNSNMMFGAYGEGGRPNITGVPLELRGENNVVRDISWTDGSSVFFGTWGSGGGDGGIMFNCVVESRNGLAIWGRNNKVIGCSISGSNSNGIWLQQRDPSQDSEVEFAYNHIFEVNKGWFDPTRNPNSWGDGIQICTFRGHFHVHHNLINRSDTGNKFCFICNVLNDFDLDVTGTLENNVFIGPKNHPSGGNIIYLEGNQRPFRLITIRNNVLIGTYDDYSDSWTGGAIVVREARVEVYGNIIKDVRIALDRSSDVGGDSYFYNNTVLDIKSNNIILAPLAGVHNNIFPWSYSGGDSNANNISLINKGNEPEDIFKDEKMEDYRLKKESPAISGGMWQNYMNKKWTKDLLGNNVPQNNNINIGAIMNSS